MVILYEITDMDAPGTQIILYTACQLVKFVSFCFTPTSLGMVIQVKHVGGGILDITDYDSF